MKNQYTYDAFISYRHCELDKFVAENLHKQMESFKLPGNVAKAKETGRKKIERVFRDKDELPISSNLEDPIMKALEGSEYLIVICTPRIRESLWCRKEIENFIKMHGREKVLAVLAEGEPSESFPEELLYKEVTALDESGKEITVKEPVEPLAADVRGKDEKAVLKAIKEELPRLLAPMFGLSYDDLKQRHRERRMKKIMAAAFLVAGVGAVFGTVSTMMALQINAQKNQIEEKNMEITYQNSTIQLQASELEAQNKALLEDKAKNLARESKQQLESGDRIGAIHTAVLALTEVDGTQMPYTPQAQYALTESMYTYNKDSTFRQAVQFNTPGAIRTIVVSPSREKVALIDEAHVVSIYDMVTFKLLGRIMNQEVSFSQTKTGAFVTDSLYVYITEDKRLCSYNLETGSYGTILDDSNSTMLTVSKDQKYLAISNWDGVTILDSTDFSLVDSFGTERMKYPTKMVMQEVGGTYYLAYYVYEFGGKGNQVGLYNMSTKEQIFLPFDEDFSVDDMLISRGKLYVTSNRYNEAYTKADGCVNCYDLANAKELWRKIYDGETISKIVDTDGDSNHLFVEFSWEAAVIDGKDGEIFYTTPFGSSIIHSYAVADSDLFANFTYDGQLHLCNALDGTFARVSSSFNYQSNDLYLVDNCYGGFITVEANKNCAVLYGLFEDDIEPNATEVESPESTWRDLSIDEQDAILRTEYFVDNKMAKSAVAYEEDNLIFVSYLDGMLRIYDTKEKTMLAELDTQSYGMNVIYGKDKNGNYYIGDYSVAYILNPDFECIGRVAALVAVNAEENYLVRCNYSEGYQYNIPIYTVDELLEKANEIMLKYNYEK